MDSPGTGKSYARVRGPLKSANVEFYVGIT